MASGVELLGLFMSTGGAYQTHAPEIVSLEVVSLKGGRSVLTSPFAKLDGWPDSAEPGQLVSGDMLD